jgi:hypothetical protein
MGEWDILTLIIGTGPTEAEDSGEGELVAVSEWRWNGKVWLRRRLSGSRKEVRIAAKHRVQFAVRAFKW